MVNQRKKHFAEERAKAKRNNPMTQSQLRIYMSKLSEESQRNLEASQLKNLVLKRLKKSLMNIYAYIGRHYYIYVSRIGNILCQKILANHAKDIKLLDGTIDEVCYKLLKMIEKQDGIRK
ncbi:hypothetical protein Tco_0476317 [Tanacetum coccineum]